MDFKLFDSKVEGINVSITVHIGPYSISVDEYRWDKSFERENSLKGISISKTMEAAGVSRYRRTQDFHARQLRH